MSMNDSLVGKVAHTIKGMAHDAVDALRDPGRDARQDTRDIGAAISDADKHLLEVKADVALLDARAKEHQAAVDKWQESAGRALDQGDQALARECLVRKAKDKGEQDQVNSQLGQLRPLIERLEGRIRELQAERDAMASRTEALEARNRVAIASEKVANALGAIDGIGGVQDFKRLEDDVLRREAHANAALEQADSHSGASLEMRVAALATPSVDDELAALMHEKTSGRQISAGGLADQRRLPPSPEGQQGSDRR